MKSLQQHIEEKLVINRKNDKLIKNNFDEYTYMNWQEEKNSKDFEHILLLNNDNDESSNFLKNFFYDIILNLKRAKRIKPASALRRIKKVEWDSVCKPTIIYKFEADNYTGSSEKKYCFYIFGPHDNSSKEENLKLVWDRKNKSLRWYYYGVGKVVSGCYAIAETADNCWSISKEDYARIINCFLTIQHSCK